MNDSSRCFICNAKIKAFNRKNSYLFIIDKVSDWIERTCSAPNHTITTYADSSKKINLINISLTANNSKYIYLDLLNNKSYIHCMKNSESYKIEIPKLIILDFPKLEKFKQFVDLYITFS